VSSKKRTLGRRQKKRESEKRGVALVWPLEMQAHEFPSLRQLIADDRERTNFVAFASESYAQGEVLFLCAIHDLDTSSGRAAEMAHAIFDGTTDGRRLLVCFSDLSQEYMADGAPHAVKLPNATRKAVERVLKKASKVDKTVFDGPWREVERGLTVYREYESRWLKERKVDTARRQLIGEIEFDLANPPGLTELLQSDKCARQLRVFAESIFCEEIVLFYTETMAWRKNGCDFEQGRRLCDTYVANSAVMCLNLEHEVRENVVLAFGGGATQVHPEVFAECLYAVTHQMQQNLYFQFIAHLRAIKKDLQSRQKLESLQRALKQPASADAAPLDTVYVAPSFEEVTNDPILLHELLSFAGRMYSQERVVFYVLIQDFKTQTVAEVRAKMAEKMFAEYIAENSKRQVSLEGRRFNQISTAYAELCAESGGGVASTIPPTFFDAVEKEVGRSIRNEIFDRFVQFQRLQWERQLACDPPDSSEATSSAAAVSERSRPPALSPRKLLALLKKK
jgi:hypothetical protein